MKTVLHIILIGSLITVSACGDQPGERALSGGAIGAGAGALTGAAVGGSVAGGALLGGVAGAAVGGLTNKSQLDLDR